MVFSILSIIFGLFLLMKGADFLVDGSVSVSKKLGVPTIVIGLTIVAFGTSAPELVVSILAALKGSADISVGNIIGSNISNILLILGISALFGSLYVKRSITAKEIPFSLIAVIILAILANDAMFFNSQVNQISRGDGLIMLLFFAIFLYYIFTVLKGSREKIVPEIHKYSTPISVVMIVLGLAALVVGGNLTVTGASEIARLIGISERIIGLTIVAIGTSLPELITSVVAVKRGETDLAVGNIVGSNIFNILWILGFSSIIAPINFSTAMNFDILVNLVATIILIGAIYIGKRDWLSKKDGIVFILLYVAYIVHLIL